MVFKIRSCIVHRRHDPSNVSSHLPTFVISFPFKSEFAFTQSCWRYDNDHQAPKCPLWPGVYGLRFEHETMSAWFTSVCSYAGPELELPDERTYGV